MCPWFQKGSAKRVMKICLLVSSSELVEVGTVANLAYFRGPAFSSSSALKCSSEHSALQSLMQCTPRARAGWKEGSIFHTIGSCLPNDDFQLLEIRPLYCTDVAQEKEL